MVNIKDIAAKPPHTVCLGLHPGIIQSMLDYEYMCGKPRTSIQAIIGGGRKQERFFWGAREIIIPVYVSMHALSDTIKKRTNTVISLQSARRVLSSMQEAVDVFPKLHMATVFAEQVPEAHALQLMRLAREHGILVAGPASVGVLIPGVLKLGAIGGITPMQIKNAKIARGGDVAVISTSGGMVNELIHTVTRTSNRVSFAIAMGGDRFPVLSPAEAVLLAESDPKTKIIVYFGELGGQDEYEIAELLKTKKVRKPLLAYIAGEVATLFETPPQFGHAKAMAQNQEESAAAKKQALRVAGATVVDSITGIADVMKARKSRLADGLTERVIGDRHKRAIASRLSGDIEGDVYLLGEELLDVVERTSFEALVISMLIGRPVDAPKLARFTDYVLRLLADHGPYVSGALNTITTARAGRDLVSSLAAGLLTIGPRFGGALNEAAHCWLSGAHAGITPKKFVESFTARGGIIPGIGHKKYRIDAPDPRVAKLLEFAGNSNGDVYLQFALGVQKVTTSKKGNLILNVDGCIAAIMLDLLESELELTASELQELVDVEFFNALFILSRSLGFMAHYMDQRRNDEGLLRFSDEHISYIPYDK